MNIWSSEIKELNQICQSVKETIPQLGRELGKLVTTNDENMLLVYSRRCLEVIITDLCELELKRDRGSEPLQRIIDRLNKEKVVPHNIIVSMQSVNSMSTFGAHPKEFETEQVKPVLHNLKTILKWYLSYVEEKGPAGKETDSSYIKSKKQTELKQGKSKAGKRMILVSSILLAAAVIAIVLNLLNINGKDNVASAASIGSIVVLPFSNYTGQDSLDYFVDGMHSSLITDMGKVGSLRIPGATTSQVFKNSKKTIKEIASELKVDAALETAVMCLGQDSICFQTRLIKPGQEEIQLWTADYKIAKDQILNWYNGVTKQIAEEVNVELTPEEDLLLAESRTIDWETYKAYLMGYNYLGDLSLESLLKAKDYLNIAIERDPDWAPLYASMATVWFSLVTMGGESPEIAIPSVYENLNKALELDPELAEAHYVNAFMAAFFEWDWVRGEKEFLKAIAINPSFSLARMHYSHLLYALQRQEEAGVQAEMGYKLDPLNPIIQSTYAVALTCGWDCKSALSIMENLLAKDSDNYLANSVTESAAFQCGDLNKLFEATNHIIKVGYPDAFNVEELNKTEKIYNESGFKPAYTEILRKLDIHAEKGTVVPVDMAFKYYVISDDNKAIEWIEKGFEIHDANVIYIGTGYLSFTRLYNNPRFIEVLNKLNLPQPKSD